MNWLEQDGYRLRAPEPEDLAFMHRFENTPSLWEVSDTTGPYSRYCLKQYIEQNQNDIYTDRQLRLMIETPEGDVAGMADLFHFEPIHARAEVGIVVAPEYRNREVASLALRLLADYALNYLHLHQLVALTASDNEASNRLFQRCGFEHTACLRQWKRRADQYQDVNVWQLLRH